VTIVKKELEVTICDNCEEDICVGELEWMWKCFVCGKDMCAKCNPIADLSYQSFSVTLCPEHALNTTITEFIGFAEKKLKEHIRPYDKTVRRRRIVESKGG